MKRAAEKQMSKDDRSDGEDDGPKDPATLRAAPEVLAQRKILTVKRGPGNEPQTKPSAFAFSPSAVPTAKAALSSGALAATATSAAFAKNPFSEKAPIIPPFAAVLASGKAPATAAAPSSSTDPVGTQGKNPFSNPFKTTAPLPEKNPFAFAPPPRKAEAEPAPNPQAPEKPPAPTFNFKGGFDFKSAVNAFAAAKVAQQEIAAKAQTEEEGGDDGEVEGSQPQTAPEPEVTQVAAGVTGEEDETELQVATAKLFRFGENKSWHERGTGTIKINKKTSDGSVRLLMRDQRLKKGLLNLPIGHNFRIAAKAESHFIITVPEKNDSGAVHIASYLIKFLPDKGVTAQTIAKSFMDKLTEVTPAKS